MTEGGENFEMGERTAQKYIETADITLDRSYTQNEDTADYDVGRNLRADTSMELASSAPRTTMLLKETENSSVEDRIKIRIRGTEFAVLSADALMKLSDKVEYIDNELYLQLTGGNVCV